MKRFLFRFFLFFTILFIIELSLTLLIRTQRPSDYKLFIESKKDFFRKKQNYELIIIGDSHIADALDTRIIEKNNTITSFNLAIYSSSPFQNYFITKQAINSVSEMPKLVMLGTNPIMFHRTIDKGVYTPLIINKFLIYYELLKKSNDGIDFSILFKSINEKGIFKHIFQKNINKKYVPTRIIKSVYNGHLEFYNQNRDVNWTNYRIKNYKNENLEKQLYYFEKTIQLLLDNNIKVIIVNPPIWHKKFSEICKTTWYDQFETELFKIADKYNINIINKDHKALDSILNQSDFLNPDHLNYYGAIKFSQHVSNTLILDNI